MAESYVQTILIPKKNYTKKEAAKWIVDHGYELTHKRKLVDITPNYYRYRQNAARPRRSFRASTITLPRTKQIKMVIYYF